MSPLSFNLLYSFLMFFALFTAFFLPAKVSDSVRNSTVVIFAPVSRPSRAVGDWFVGKVAPVGPADPEAPGKSRDADAVRIENSALRVQLQFLTLQLDELKRLNRDREQLGVLRPLCEPAAVIGGDTGGRQSLAISTSTLPNGSANDAPVLTAMGLVGRVVEGIGVGAARVRLITDRTSRVTAHVERYFSRPDGKLDTQQVTLRTAPLVEGAGSGRMTIQMPDYDAKLVHLDDVVLLDDTAWPQKLKGWRIGKVTKIDARASAPGFYDLVVEPTMDLSRLREVQVMVRGR